MNAPGEAKAEQHDVVTSEAALELCTRTVKTYGVCRHLDENDSLTCAVCASGPRISSDVKVTVLPESGRRRASHAPAADAAPSQEAQPSTAIGQSVVDGVKEIWNCKDLGVEEKLIVIIAEILGKKAGPFLGCAILIWFISYLLGWTSYAPWQ